jgi:hypothetical protein
MERDETRVRCSNGVMDWDDSNAPGAAAPYPQ